MNEEWKDIPGFESDYQVSSFGQVRSKDRVILAIDGRALKMKGRIIKAAIASHGYLAVGLWKNSKDNRRTVHSLVADVFIPNPAKHPIVDHINRDKLDNRAENLRWVNYSKNGLNNSGSPRGNNSHIGVQFHHRYRKPWAACLGNTIIGRYVTQDEAILARKHKLSEALN